MKRATVASFLALLLSLGTAFAQGHPAAQHAEDIANENQVFDTGRWVEIHTTTIKMPAQKDLFISATLECALFQGTETAPFADAVVRVSVTVDGRPAGPGRFEFCGKTAAANQKVITCTNANGGRAHWSRCGLTDQEKNQIRRASRTVTANWVLKDVGVGVHRVTVKAYLWKGTAVEDARAFVGDGSLLVEIVRLVRGS